MRNFRNAIATLSVVAILSSLVVSTAFAGSFGDVPADAYYFNAVEELASQGIVDSTKTNYEPGRQLQRQEAAKLIVESSGLMADVPAVGHFTDVPNTLWSYNSVETAYANGVVNGYSTAQGDLTGQFGPLDTVTRAQFAKMVVEAFDLPAYTPASPTFPDVQNTNDWYYSYVETAAYHGIVNGYGNGRFGANDNINRADGAVMIYRALGAPVPPEGDDVVVPEPGDVTISLGDTPASSVVPANATRVPFLVMDVEGAGTLKSLTIERFGAGSTSDFSNVYLYDGDTRLTSGRTLNSSTHRATFTGLNYVVDGMSELTVMADMNGASGDVNGFRLYEVASDDNVSFGDVEGELMSISSATVGSLVITKGANPTNPKIGETDAKVAEFRLAAGSSEAVDVYGITLYQGGGISSSNLSNFVLMQGGVEVATADAVLSNDTIVLTFDTPYNLGKGDSRIFELYADVGQGAKASATETIRVYLENKVDLYTVGSVYGYGVEVSNGVYTGSTVPALANGTYDGSGTNYSEVTVEGGQVTMSFQGPSIQDYAINTKDVELMRFNIVAQNNIEVRKTNLKITTTVAAPSDFTNIELFDVDTGELLVGPWDSPVVVPGFDSETLQDVWNMDAGEARTLAFRADISNTSPVGTVKIQLDPFVYGDIRNLDNNTNIAVADIVPTSAIVGNVHNVLSATATVTKAGTPTTQTYINGSSNLDMAGFVVSAGAGKDSYLRSLTIEAVGTGSCSDTGLVSKTTDCVTTVSLWDGTTQLGDTKSLSTANKATFNGFELKIAKGTSKTLLIKTSLNTLSNNALTSQVLTGTVTTVAGVAVVGSGTSFTTEVKPGDFFYVTLDGTVSKIAVATVTSNTALTLAAPYAGTVGASLGATIERVPSTLLYRIPSIADLTINDIEGNPITPIMAALLSGNVHNISSAGTVTVDVAANEQNVTDSRNIIMGMSGVTLAKFKISAQNESLKLAKVPVDVVGLSGLPSNEVLSVYLYDGTTKIAGPVTPNGTGVALFSTFSQDFVIPKNGNKILTVVVDLSTKDDATSGAEVVATLLANSSDFEVRSAGGSNTTIYGNLAGLAPRDGYPMRIRLANLTLSRIAVASTTFLPTSELYKFNVEVNPNETTYLKQITFEVTRSILAAGDAYTVGSSKLKKDGVIVGDASGTGAIAITESISTAGDVDTVTLTFNSSSVGALNELPISGSNNVFTLEANITGTIASNDTVTTKLLTDTDLTAGPMGLTTAVADLPITLGSIVVTDTENFVWSDGSSNVHSADNTTVTSVDWSNGYLLKNLSLGSQTLLRP